MLCASQHHREKHTNKAHNPLKTEPAAPIMAIVLQGLQVIFTLLPICALKVVSQKTEDDGFQCLNVGQLKVDH